VRRLGLGVVGLGEGRSIISAGIESDRWDVVQLCDLDAELRARRCREFGIGSSTDSIDELLANPAVDVVGIYTPDRSHAEHVISALRAGKHVICTKPFLDSLDRAGEVLDTQRSSGKAVFVGQSARFFHSFARQRRHFETGAFGDLITIEAAYHADHRWFLAKPWAVEPGFRWLFGALSHPVDLVRWYVPDIQEVTGASILSRNGRAAGLVHDDTFHFVLRSASGVLARVSGSYSGPTVPAERDSGMTCILRADSGASQADYHELRYAWKIGDRSVVEYAEEELADFYFRFEGRTHHAGEYQEYLDYLAVCLDLGETPRPDASEGVGTVAVLEAMEEACRTRMPVQVEAVLARHGLDSDSMGGRTPSAPPGA
jgi:predicted dehydrogenase